MSAVADRIDVDTLVPDGFEPVEALRCWQFHDGKLLSLNGVEWTPGEALKASCVGHADELRWTVVRRGMTREQAASLASFNNQRVQMYPPSLQPPSWTPEPPQTVLPDGYGFELETITHDAPHGTCHCGIYAATNNDQLPPHGRVYGKVKLWGKIVPGERGVRAQYAYPSEFEVAPDLVDHPALKAFGVPIKVTQRKTKAEPMLMLGMTLMPDEKRRMHWALKIAIASNLAACIFNLSLLWWPW